MEHVGELRSVTGHAVGKVLVPEADGVHHSVSSLNTSLSGPATFVVDLSSHWEVLQEQQVWIRCILSSSKCPWNQIQAKCVLF